MIRHITINTSNIDESILFYEKHIGLNITRDLRAHGFPIVFLGTDADETQIELIDRPEQAYQGTGISIGFPVDDIEESYKYFTEQGLQPTPIISPDGKSSFFFIKDPSGLSIQMIH